MAMAAEQFEADEIKFVGKMKELGLAERVYAGDNNDQFATNFDQMTNELSSYYNGPLLTNVDFVNVGMVNDQYPQMIMFRERNPRQAPGGAWHREYGLVDGSVQTAISPDDNFNAWEEYDHKLRAIMFSPPSNINR